MSRPKKEGVCSVKNCQNSSVVIHKPTNSEYCDRHWIDKCNADLKAWEDKKKAKKEEVQ